MTYLLAGERAGLGPMRRDLVPDYTRWINQPEVREGTGGLGFHTDETELAWFERVSTASAARTPDEAHFTIYDLEDDAPVGTAGLFAINHLHGVATFGIALGERRGQGLGTDATRLVVRWGFGELGLHNIWLAALAWNAGAIAAYRRAGFTDVGVRHRAVWSRGERSDEHYMEIVRDRPA
jgi:RimJ/RimL family protein N-acetyltransferase